MVFFLFVFLLIAGVAVALYWLARRNAELQAVVPQAPLVPAAPPPPRPEHVALVEELDAVGFFGHLPVDRAEAWKADLRTGGYVWNPDFGRVYLYDEAELGECGPRDLIEEARPFLESQGVPLGVVQQKAVVGLQVELTINGKLQVLLEAGETDTLEEAAATVTKRTFKLLNRLLEKAGSPERAYRLRQDFNATVVFLTHDQLRVLIEQGDLKEDEVPEAA